MRSVPCRPTSPLSRVWLGTRWAPTWPVQLMTSASSFGGQMGGSRSPQSQRRSATGSARPPSFCAWTGPHVSALQATVGLLGASALTGPLVHWQKCAVTAERLAPSTVGRCSLGLALGSWPNVALSKNADAGEPAWKGLDTNIALGMFSCLARSVGALLRLKA